MIGVSYILIFCSATKGGGGGGSETGMQAKCILLSKCSLFVEDFKKEK